MVDILIVEDERVAAWNIQVALQNFGYTVVANVASGKKGVDLAETLKPDLVLIDIRLPGEMDGIEAATRIRNQFHIPVVYLTAHSNDHIIERAIATDPYGYLIKPFKRIELHTTIITALRRCQAENQLLATKQWLASTLNSIGDGMIATNLEGRINFINPVAETITGWQASQAVGKSINQVLNLYHGETGLAMENPLLRTMQEGIPIQLPQCLLLTKSGTERLIDHVATPIRDAFGNVQGGVMVFRDITESQRMQTVLQKSEARFHLLAANLPGVMYRVLHQLDGSVEWNYISPSFQNLFEMDLESFQQGGDRLQTAIHPDDASSMQLALDTALSTLQPLKWEGRILVPSGEIKWIQVISRPTQQANGEIIFDGLIVDISDAVQQAASRLRKRTEQALQRQLQREQLFNKIAKQINKSLDLNEILTTVVTEVRQILQVERVLIFQRHPDGSAEVVQESVDSGLSATFGLRFPDEFFPPDSDEFYRRKEPVVITDTECSSNCMRELMQQFGVKSKVVIPIMKYEDTNTTSLKSQTAKLWGVLILHACYDYRQWQPEEVDLLRQISHSLGIAIQQSELYQKLKQANQQLEYLAMIDGLTQVANRRRFDEYIQQQWNQLMREQTPLSLILSDIDYFKRYNDTYGHPAGDECLVQIAQAIKRAVKSSADLVARYGGEEFAVILPNMCEQEAVLVAITIQNQVRQLQLDHLASDVENYVTVSIGIASTVPSPNSSPQALIAAADRELYQAKQQGRDRYYVSTL